jgi:hypothetical protein
MESCLSKWVFCFWVLVSSGLSFAAEHENLLPNSQWQIATAIGSSPKMNSAGTAVMPPIVVTGYTTGTNTITATTANTGELEVGNLVMFQSPCEASLTRTTSCIDALVKNASFTVSLPLGRIAKTSSACNAIPTMAGGVSSIGTGDALDGWSKSITAQVWREGHRTNNKLGSLYSAGFKKGDDGTEIMNHSVEKRDVGRFQGRQVVFGVWVYHKVHHGRGTWRAFISTRGSKHPVWYSPRSSKTTYDWKEISATIPSDADAIDFGISFEGSRGDVYYVSQPMASFGTFLGVGNYRSPYHETLIPRVKITPYSHYNANCDFPTQPSANANLTEAYGGGVGDDFGFYVRPYPETNGAIAPTVRRLLMQIEARSDKVTVARSNALVPLRLKVSAAGKRGAAAFQISADQGTTWSHPLTPLEGANTFRYLGPPWSADANNSQVKYQVFQMKDGEYREGDSWTVATDGSILFSGRGYNGIAIAPQIQRVVIAARNQETPPCIYGILCEAKAPGGLESGAGTVTLDDKGDFFLYTTTLGGRWYNESMDINGFEL